MLLFSVVNKDYQWSTRSVCDKLATFVGVFRC